MVYHYIAIGCNIDTPVYEKENWMNAMPCHLGSHTDREHMEQQGQPSGGTGGDDSLQMEADSTERDAVSGKFRIIQIPWFFPLSRKYDSSPLSCR